MSICLFVISNRFSLPRGFELQIYRFFSDLQKKDVSSPYTRNHPVYSFKLRTILSISSSVNTGFNGRLNSRQ